MSNDLHIFFTDFACDIFHIAGNFKFKGILKTTPYQLDYEQAQLHGQNLILVAPTESVKAIQRHDTLEIENTSYIVLDERMDGTGISYLTLEKISP